MAALFPVFPVEDQIITVIQANSNIVFDLFFKAITQLGNPALWLVVAALLYWSNRERQSFFLVNVIVFSAATAAAMKFFIARPRPSELLHRVFPQENISRILEGGAPDYGFPSGHATTISAVLSFYSKNKGTIIIALFAITALLVSISRLYLGVHFPLDAISGLAIGAIIGILTLWIDKVFENHKFHLTKIEDEIIVVLLIALGIVAIALFDVPVLAATILGYYTGFFLSKEISFRQTEFSGKRKLLKYASGMLSAAIMFFLTVTLYSINKPLALFFFFTNGFWITYGFPKAFQETLEQTEKAFPLLKKFLD